MLKSIIVLLDRAARSFCHYANSDASEQWISPADLSAIVDHAIRHRLTLNCLLGTRPLPAELDALLAQATHVKLVAPQLCEVYPHAIVIVESAEEAEALTPLRGRNVILRLARQDLPRLCAIVETLFDRCGRINLHLLELDAYTDKEVEAYRRQLEDVIPLLQARYSAGDLVEVSFLSDRMIHRAMHNCNAGVEHLTFAPDGQFYLCPGFFQDGAAAVGDLTQGIQLSNPQLYQLDHAPICSICDAFHCKRCVYLNKKLTGEVNTPSAQQCIVAHLERNGASRLLASLQQVRSFRAMKPFGEVMNLDPFRQLVAPARRPPVQVRDGYRLVTLPPLERVRPAFQKSKNSP